MNVKIFQEKSEPTLSEQASPFPIMNPDSTNKDEVKRVPRRYRRRHKTNKPKPITEEKEPKTTKPINLVTFTFD